MLSNCFGDSPYAPSSIRGTQSGADTYTFSYDVAGNRLSKVPNQQDSPRQTVKIGLTSRPVLIQQGSIKELFHYGLHAKPYLRIHSDNRKTLYVQDVEYRIAESGEISSAEYAIQLKVKGYSPDVQVKLSATTIPHYTYLVKDHLGSPICSIDMDGNVEKQLRFDPWGETTKPSGIFDDPRISQNPDALKKAEFNRGFTGHTTIASLNLLHMNSRVFDPELGLFLNPDPVLSPNSLVNHNRYCYVNNNPINLIDPSGMAPEETLNWENFTGSRFGKKNLPLSRDNAKQVMQGIVRRGKKITSRKQTKDLLYFFATMKQNRPVETRMIESILKSAEHGLSLSEASQIFAYTTAGYYEFNRQAHEALGGTPRGDFYVEANNWPRLTEIASLADSQTLNSALAKLPVEVGRKVYHGVDDFYVAQMLFDLTNGDTFDPLHYISTTTNAKEAWFYTNEHEFGGEKYRMMAIIKSLSGHDITAFSINAGYDEILLNPGSNFHVYKKQTIAPDDRHSYIRLLFYMEEL